MNGGMGGGIVRWVKRWTDSEYTYECLRLPHISLHRQQLRGHYYSSIARTRASSMHSQTHNPHQSDTFDINSVYEG